MRPVTANFMSGAASSREIAGLGGASEAPAPIAGAGAAAGAAGAAGAGLGAAGEGLGAAGLGGSWASGALGLTYMESSGLFSLRRRLGSPALSALTAW